MRALAEFVMRGRTQAMLVTVISAGTLMLYWLGAAALALVTLRQGSKEGFLLLIWSILPASAIAWYGGEIAPLVVLAGCWLTAWILKELSSWPIALVVATIFGMLVSAGVYVYSPQWLVNVQAVVVAFLENFKAQLPPEAEVPEFLQPGLVLITGMLGLFQVLTIVSCLALARSWQAKLYNPGGFRQEFHSLRLPRPLAIGVLLVALVCAAAGGEMLSWAYMAAVPLLVAGLGLLHGLIASRNMGGLALAFAYGLLLLVNPAKDLLILAALLDSWLDFRRRTPSQQQD